MLNRNRISIVLVTVISLLLVWYLLIKKSDYSISFKVKTATGTVFQGIQDWSTARAKNENEVYEILEKRKFDLIKQDMKSAAGHFEYTWIIDAINDSVTAVNVDIKDYNNSIYNRITAPFINTNFRAEQIRKITEFKNGLNDHLKNFKISIEGAGSSTKTYVAYLNLNCVMQEKAQTMIANDAIITGFLQSNKIKIVGRPYVEIVNWDLEKEILNFNYCFPVEKQVNEIDDINVKFKTINAVKGLTATYYGNFRTSDRAWFALLDYAKRQGYKLDKRPLEHFLANPFNGGNELEWETKIIIPFAKN